MTLRLSMNHFFPFFSRLSILGLALLMPILAGAQEKDKAQVSDGSKREARKQATALDSLRPEEKERLRKVLRSAWSDPSVINAREDVQRASEAYQSAIRSAVERMDPSAVEWIARMQGRGHSPVGRGNEVVRFEDQNRALSWIESLDPEIRDRVRKAEKEAEKAEAVVKARESLGKIHEEDEALRRRRLEAHRELRRATVEEILRIDPSLISAKKLLLGAGGMKKQDHPEASEKDSRKTNSEKPKNAETLAPASEKKVP